MTRIELDDGKYTVVHDSGAGLHALRYGEHWRDMTGDGLVLAMAQEIEDLRRRIVPVQQVSVPDVSAMARILADRNADACNVNREDNWMIYGQDYIDDVTAMLAAAPAAPAADAGLIEALGYQALFDAIAAATSVYANGAVNISVQAFRDALAASRAKGVV